MGGALRPELDPVDEQLLRLISEGQTLEAAARRVGISERTARRRLRALAEVFGVETTIQVVVHAVRTGLL